MITFSKMTKLEWENLEITNKVRDFNYDNNKTYNENFNNFISTNSFKEIDIKLVEKIFELNYKK